jgi:DNA polymerase-3 subunit delta'
MDLFGEPAPPAQEEPVSIIDATTPAEPKEAFTHPRGMDICLGHEAVEKALLENINSGRMPHGLIFSGPKGIGKATLAYRLAKYLLHHGTPDPNQDSLFGDDAPAAEYLDIDPASQAAHLVTSGGHPDLMSVERAYDATKNTYKAGVEVAEIRKVTPFLRMTASYGGWRIVIIDDADSMNRSSQNALLKILEEPPANTLLILVTHRLGSLIPTIRSRTQLVNLQPLGTETLERLLARAGHSVTGEKLNTLLHLSGGSFGRAQQLLEEGGLDTLDTITSSLESYPNWDWPAIHTLADTLGRTGQNKAYDLFAELMSWTMSELVLAKAKGQGIGPSMLDKPALQTMLKNSSLEQLLKICENLHSHFAKVNYANLDKKQGVLQAFMLISAQ